MGISVAQTGVSPANGYVGGAYSSATMGLSGVSVGQVVYAYISYAGTLTSPSGWTIEDGGGSSDGYCVAYRVLTSAAAAGSSYTWSWSSPTWGFVAWMILTGASRSNFGGAHGKANYNVGAAKNTPSEATTTGDATIAIIYQPSPVNIVSSGYTSQF